MNVDLKYNYDDALRRQNLTQSQVDLLREASHKCESIPKSLTNKQVKYLRQTITSTFR
jgi:hypothetical protein